MSRWKKSRENSWTEVRKGTDKEQTREQFGRIRKDGKVEEQTVE